MITALVVGNVRHKQKNFASFLDQTAMFKETYFCTNLQEMADFLTKRSVDVIFSLEASRDFTTADIFTTLKKKEEWCDIPVFIFSENVSAEQRVQALEMGAADFLTSQTPPMEISALTQFHVTKKHRIEKLRITQETLFKRANTDPLTGLNTWDYFQTVLEEREKAEIAGPNHYAVLVIQPDFFNSIGETLGQNFSQKILKTLGEALSKICRRGDPLCRMDDHAFGLLLPHVNEQQAYAAAERIRKKISGHPMDYPVTVSIGISARRGRTGNNANDTVNRACLALKSASSKGSNRSEFLPEEISHEALCKILDAGTRAPSGLNNQPWKFVIIRDADIRLKLAELTKYSRIIRDAPVCLAVFIDRELIYHETKDYQAMGACIQNMLLAAHGMGLGAVWLGEILKNSDAVNTLLEVPDGLELMAVVALGRPEHLQKKKPRKGLEEVVLKEL